MKSTAIIILILILFCNVVNSLEYESQIGVKGEDSYLYADTNVDAGSDHVAAQGEQEYSRSYAGSNDETLFVSKYNLSRAIGKGIASYSIISLAGNPTHSMKLTSRSDINTSNWIEYNKKGITSRYRAATYGRINELVSAEQGWTHPSILAKTAAQGDITFKTKLSNGDISGFASDADRLSKSLDSVPVIGEVGKKDITTQSSDITLNGEDLLHVDDGFNGTTMVGDTQLTINKNSTFNKMNNEEEIAKTKESAASEYSDEGVYRFITMKPNIHRLILMTELDPMEGPVDTIVTTKIRVINYGEPELKYVHVMGKLPKGLDFLDSPNGTYCNGYLKWPGITEMKGNQEINLTFRAKVNEDALNYAYLNSTFDANGVTTEGESKIANDGIAMFKLNQEDLAENDGSPMDEPLSIMSASINVQQMADVLQKEDDKYALSGDKINYSNRIQNIGDKELENISVIANLGQGMKLIPFESHQTLPIEILNASSLQYAIGNLSPGKEIILNYVAEIDGSSLEDGDDLENSISVSGKDGNNTIKENSVSKITYLSQPLPTLPGNGKGTGEANATGNILSRMEIEDGVAYITTIAPEMKKRVPLNRTSVHLGRQLIYDRRLYGGWVDPRTPEYFITDQVNASQEYVPASISAQVLQRM